MTRKTSDRDRPPQARPTLPMCAACKGALPPGAKFCGYCGTPAGAELPPPTLPRPAVPAPADGSGSFQALATPASAGPDSITTEGGPVWLPSPEPSDILSPGSTVGEYRVERLLGAGAMGLVYGVVHPVIGRRAAIKVLRRSQVDNAEATARFLREAQAACRVHHENVIDVFGYGALPDGRPYFVMEWLEGETLRQRLARPISVAEATRIIAQIADALAVLHKHGVVHRDLKPDNVLLVDGHDGPMAKVVDFGVAKLMAKDEPLGRLTKLGFVVGSAEYASPEQAAGHPVDERADVYSLGVVLFELLTRRRPFSAPTATDLLVEHIVEPPPSPSSLVPTLPPALDALVLSMLGKDPGSRPTLAGVRVALAPFSLWRAAAGSIAPPIGTPTPNSPLPTSPSATSLPLPLPLAAPVPTPLPSRSSCAAQMPAAVPPVAAPLDPPPVAVPPPVTPPLVAEAVRPSPGKRPVSETAPTTPIKTPPLPTPLPPWLQSSSDETAKLPARGAAFTGGPRRRRWPWVFAVGVALALGAAVGWLLRGT